MICFDRIVAYQPVPGCIGGEVDYTQANYCIDPYELHHYYLPPPSGMYNDPPTTTPNTYMPHTPYPVDDTTTTTTTVLPNPPSPTMEPHVTTDNMPAPSTPEEYLPSGSSPPPVPTPTVPTTTTDDDNTDDLIPLVYIGVDPPPPFLPLKECEGDCDTDVECSPGLVCLIRDVGDPIPGCAGDINGSRTDYCVKEEYRNSTNNMTNDTVIVDVDDAYTLPPITTTSTSPPEPAEEPVSEPVPEEPVSEPEPVTESETTPETDVHTEVDDTNDANNDMPFRLRLYWEDGYTWQESTEETYWCADCLPYGHCYNGATMYITWCQYWNKRFLFESVRSDDDDDDDEEVLFLIRIIDGYYYEEKDDADEDEDGEANLKWYGQYCLQSSTATDSKDIFVVHCNRDIPGQLWKPQSGSSFSDTDSGFEITQSGKEDLCITQRHHPKQGESIKLESCETARNSQTSKWTKY